MFVENNDLYFKGSRVVARYDCDFFPAPTVRHTDCELVVSSTATGQCDYYRSEIMHECTCVHMQFKGQCIRRYTLFSLASREKSRALTPAETPSDCTNYRL